jgi:molybdopterin synthase sulfur carrier subunit
MIFIEFLGPINKESLKLDVNSLDEVARHLQNDSEILEWLEKSAIAVNDEIIFDKKMKLKDGDKVSILPPVCGG